MERHVVIGTAGHIDHGKTALVKALTGTDTDRWAEEKRRGITIDLGFASLDLSDGLTASVVDVPGHEDFVRNMVAGATGIDVALLVVAADEGVMPQTQEHLAILEFLGVQSGIVAITKCDLVEADWLDLVESDLADRLRSSPVDFCDTVRVSAVTGAGLQEIKRALRTASLEATERSSDDLFRMPVDRVFSVAGAGTVVTGTTWSGSISNGEEVMVLPGGESARVRGVEVHGSAAAVAMPGRRTALALVGLGKQEVARGHAIVAGTGWRETSAIDVHVTLLPGARPLTQRSRVRLHVGTAEVMARVTPAEDDIIPGSTGSARLRLEAPIGCRWGDRAVLRSYSPVATVGGCVVADPWPPLRPRRPVELPAKADANPAVRLEAFVRTSGKEGVPLEDVPVRAGIAPGSVGGIVDSAPTVVRVSGRLFARGVLENAESATLRALEEYHKERPLEPGMPRELLRQVLHQSSVSDFVQHALSEAGLVSIDGKTVRLADHEPRLVGDQGVLGARVLAELQVAGSQGRSRSELEAALRCPVGRDLIDFYVRSGEVVGVAKERFYDRSSLDRLLLQILETTRDSEGATPGQLRETTGLSRKYLIPVLEWMDAASLTVRVGDTRRLGPAAKKVLNPVDTS